MWWPRRRCWPFCLLCYVFFFILLLSLVREGIEQNEVENLVIWLLDYCAFLPNRMCFSIWCFQCIHTAFWLFAFFHLQKPTSTHIQPTEPPCSRILLSLTSTPTKTDSFCCSTRLLYEKKKDKSFGSFDISQSTTRSSPHLRRPSTHTNGTGDGGAVLKGSLRGGGVSQLSGWTALTPGALENLKSETIKCKGRKCWICAPRPCYSPPHHHHHRPAAIC